MILELVGVPKPLKHSLEMILPTYGPLVQDLFLESERDEHYPGNWETIERAMRALPNLASLTINHDLFGAVSTSPHLASLTLLDVFTQNNNHLSTLATLIDRCPNLGDIRISLFCDTRPADRPLLIAALASRTSIHRLMLSGCDFINQAFVTANWKGPLRRLKIEHDDNDAIPIELYRTFVAHFSTTLQHIEYTGLLTGWPAPPARNVPFPLPALTALTLHSDYENATSATFDMPSTFDASPIKVVHLEHVTNMGRGGGPYQDRFQDGKATCTMLRRFIEVHKESLKVVTFEMDMTGWGSPSPLVGLVKYAKELGIRVEGRNSRGYQWRGRI